MILVLAELVILTESFTLMFLITTRSTFGNPITVTIRIITLDMGLHAREARFIASMIQTRKTIPGLIQRVQPKEYGIFKIVTVAQVHLL